MICWSLLATWGLGLVIFLDDYLNSLTVGATMKAVTDRFKTSRAMLAYVVDSTAAPLCLLMPISSWGAYFAGLLEKNAVAPDGQGLTLFIQSIPFMFYPIIAVLVVPLVVLGFIPRLGAMKVAEQRAEMSGELGAIDDRVDNMAFGAGGPTQGSLGLGVRLARPTVVSKPKPLTLNQPWSRTAELNPKP